MPNKQRQTLREDTWWFEYHGSAYCSPPPDNPDLYNVIEKSFATKRESIDYSPSVGIAQFHECEHWRFQASYKVHPPFSWFNPHFERTNDGTNPRCIVYDTWNYVLQETSSFEGFTPRVCAFEDGWRLLSGQIKWELLYDGAYRRFRDAVTINREISLLNFLHELREVKKMFHFWSRHLDLLTNIANGFLNHKYGWKPFLSDVVSLWNALNRCARRLKQLLSNEGKVRRFATVLNRRGELFEVLPVEGATYGGGNSIRCSDNVSDPYFPITSGHSIDKPGLQVRALIKYSYGLPKVSVAQAKLRALLGAFGLEIDPQIIWDAIPFSFIVDWFWRVGDWAHDMFALSSFPVDLRIHEACFTYSPFQTTTCSASYPRGDVTADPPVYDHEIVTYAGKRFYRHRHLPSRADLLYAGWAQQTLVKVFTGSALVFTNTSRKVYPTKKLRRYGVGTHRRTVVGSPRRRFNIPGNWATSAMNWT